MKNEELLQKLLKFMVENGSIEEVKWIEKLKPELMGVKIREARNYYLVTVRLHPTSDSNITVAIALPAPENWNGKFLGVGNGGSAGLINPLALTNGVAHGYATAHTDMGTTPDPDDCIGRPERWIDFGHRSTHLMAVVGKRLTEYFYGTPPLHAYFMGGSTGGQQALSEVQRYPEDFDGVIAIAPAYDRVRLHSFFVWNWQAMHDQEDAVFTPEQTVALKDEIVRRYEEQAWNAPGDEFLAVPANVKVDLAAIRAETDLLSNGQYEAMKKIYAGPVDSVTGEQIIPGFVPGTEGEALSLMEIVDKDKFAHDFFYLFRWIWGRDYDCTAFDFHRDLQAAIRTLSPILDAVNPDISAFRDRGGKLLMISGLSDAIIPYGGAQNYYDRVLSLQGAWTDSPEQKLMLTQKFFRYFQVPGLAHVFDGPGVQELGHIGFEAVSCDPLHDCLCALEQWVEQGKAPEILLATALESNSLTGDFDHDRPAYPYPELPKYISGDPKDPRNYERRKVVDTN